MPGIMDSWIPPPTIGFAKGLWCLSPAQFGYYSWALAGFFVIVDLGGVRDAEADCHQYVFCGFTLPGYRDGSGHGPVVRQRRGGCDQWPQRDRLPPCEH